MYLILQICTYFTIIQFFFFIVISPLYCLLITYFEFIRTNLCTYFGYINSSTSHTSRSVSYLNKINKVRYGKLQNSVNSLHCEFWHLAGFLIRVLSVPII